MAINQFGNIGDYVDNTKKLFTGTKLPSSIGGQMNTPIAGISNIGSLDPNTGLFTSSPDAFTQSIMPVTPKPLISNTLAPIQTVKMTEAPINKVNTSDVSIQAASLKTQIEQVQRQLDEKRAELEKQQKAENTATPPTAPSMWDTLMGKVQDVGSQISTTQENLKNQTTDIYNQWGLTPENFNKLQTFSTQLSDINQQLVDMDTKEQLAISDAQNRAGTDASFAAGETSRIQRDYGIQKAGLAAKASVISSQASAMQGNWDTAYKMAQNYVSAATYEAEQNVSNIKWGLEQYTDIIKTMSAEDQKQTQAVLDYNTAELKRQQDDYWKQMNYDLDVYKAQNNLTASGELSPLDQLRMLQVEQAKQTTGGQVVDANTDNAVKLTDAQSQFFSMGQHLASTSNDVLNLINTMGTNAIKGWVTEKGYLVPVVQNALDPNAITLMQKMYDMNNLFVYFSTGKQLNSTEFDRLSKQLPNLKATTQTNQSAISQFQTMINDRMNSYLTLNGWKIKGDVGSAVSGGTENDPLGIR